MKLDGRRESTHVEDRRGVGGKAAGLGIGGVATFQNAKKLKVVRLIYPTQ